MQRIPAVFLNQRTQIILLHCPVKNIKATTLKSIIIYCNHIKIIWCFNHLSESYMYIPPPITSLTNHILKANCFKSNSTENNFLEKIQSMPTKNLGFIYFLLYSIHLRKRVVKLTFSELVRITYLLLLQLLHTRLDQ